MCLLVQWFSMNVAGSVILYEWCWVSDSLWMLLGQWFSMNVAGSVILYECCCVSDTDPATFIENHWTSNIHRESLNQQTHYASILVVIFLPRCEKKTQTVNVNVTSYNTQLTLYVCWDSMNVAGSVILYEWCWVSDSLWMLLGQWFSMNAAGSVILYEWCWVSDSLWMLLVQWYYVW
jgi:hypothetical protein